jgi:hypothetical protein
LETGALAIRATGLRCVQACNEVETVLFDLRFLVERVLSVEFAVFTELELGLRIPTVLLCRVIATIAFGALQSHELYCALLRLSHCESLLPGDQYLQVTVFSRCVSICPSERRAAAQSGALRRIVPSRPIGSVRRPIPQADRTALDRIRTDDPLLTMEVLCRLSYKGTPTMRGPEGQTPPAKAFGKITKE